MPRIDWNTYNATQDSTAGPVVMFVADDDGSVVEPYSNEDGSPTMGGQIGYSLALTIMLSTLLYLWYAV